MAMLSSTVDELNLITSFYNNPLLSDVKKNHDKDYKYIYAFVSALLLEYTIVDEKLKLTTVEKATEYKKATELINKTFTGELKSEITKVTGILKITMNKMINHLNSGSSNAWNVSNKITNDILNITIDGKNYSDRIYDNKNKIAKILKKQIKDLLDGKTSVNKIKDLVKKTFNTNDYMTDRLVENEISRVCRALDEQYFIDNNVQELIYVAKLDAKVCGACWELDGREYKTNDKNRPMLPLHPRCRCYYAIKE
jgi:SPP1 gp7 family putative phage head morphogenesis protein